MEVGGTERCCWRRGRWLKVGGVMTRVGIAVVISLFLSGIPSSGFDSNSAFFDEVVLLVGI